MVSSWVSVRRKRCSIVGGKEGAGDPVSTCTMGAMVRRIWAIFCWRRVGWVGWWGIEAGAGAGGVCVCCVGVCGGICTWL